MEDVLSHPRPLFWADRHLYRHHSDSHLSVSDSPLEDSDPKDTYLIPRNIMAEPDYIDDDNPELIRPQKLVNPVKTSRNHQDLHRELLMNQKRYDGFLSKVFLRVTRLLR